MSSVLPSAIKVDAVIVGAGISGLVCASALQKTCSIAVLDARTRVGGRLLSPAGVDLGASWNWPRHNKRVATLSQRLGIHELPQRLDGEAFAEDDSGTKNLGNLGERMAPCGPGAVRMRGGYEKISAALAAELPDGVLKLGCKVVSIVAGDCPGDVKLTYKEVTEEVETTLHARRVIVALPPGVLASSITFAPPLPDKQWKKMATTATWCGDWCKVVACFKTSFWRDVGASGVCATSGPISIWWEGGAGEQFGEETCALIGLGFGEACMALVKRKDSEIREYVIEKLGNVFGKQLVSSQLEAVHHKCWMLDPLTYASSASHQHIEYGHPLLRRPTEWGVHFAGTETEDCNGHVEGAVAAGQRAAAEVIGALGSKSTSL